MLEMLKVDLGIKGTAYDARLRQYIDYARAEIDSKGVVLNTTDIRDQQLIIMYAAWLWRRRDSGEGMPRMLQYALNNRVIGHRVDKGGLRSGYCD